MTALHPRRVLIIDDEPALARNTHDMLAAEGYACDRCADVDSALSLLSEQRYDLLLLDVRAPDHGDLRLLRELRASHGPSRDAPIILITGQASPDAGNPSIGPEMAGYLVKPVAVPELLARVREIESPPADPTPVDRVPAIPTSPKAGGIPRRGESSDAQALGQQFEQTVSTILDLLESLTDVYQTQQARNQSQRLVDMVQRISDRIDDADAAGLLISPSARRLRSAVKEYLESVENA